ncbi:MAG TPA: hypothetical protein VJT69_04800 [Pyrinomonadaceae bacterium]|nr:hypothetical protein [Pyrinomonadaceae bacterium]
METPIKQKKEFGLGEWRMLRTAIALIILGVLFSALTVYLHGYLHHGLPVDAELPWQWTTLLKVLDHLGLGLFSVAILGFIMELRHMKEYFQQRIETTIIKREFIKTLKHDAQEAMQKQSLEAYFGVSELGKQGDFYDFYLKKLRNHIGGAFRQDTRFKTVVQPSSDEGFFIVSDTISYICRKRVEGIQSEAGWTAEQDETKEVLRLVIITTKPDQTTETYRFDKTSNERHTSLVPNEKGHGFKISLDDYKDCDGLTVRIEVTYVVSRQRPFSFSMPVLSSGLSGEICFPDDLEIFVDLFGMDENSHPKDRLQLPKVGNFNVYEISHQGWLLPDDGFSFFFRPKEPLAPAASAKEINMLIVLSNEEADQAS